MKVSNADVLLEKARLYWRTDQADHIVRSLNYHLEAQHTYPQYNALRAMGALWSDEDQMLAGLSHAVWFGYVSEDISHIAKKAAQTVLKDMADEAGLIQVRERGQRVWRKPDPNFVELVDEAQTTFFDPADVDRMERENARDIASGQLRALYELACHNMTELELPDGLTMLDAMYMVGEHGTREVARQLGVDRNQLKARWETFQRRVAKIMEVTDG